MLALGGSTNAIIHLIAMARRLGVELSLADFEELARVTPLLANIRPSGKYLMEDFFYAGGLPGDAEQPRRPARHLRAARSTGRPSGRTSPGRRCSTKTSSAPRDDPIVENNTLAVLRGNLAPDGAVIKPAAAEERLHRHTGPAVVFENYDDMAARIDDPDLDIDENSVIVLRSAGPQGAPGHARVGAAADPEEDPGEGDPGHGADLRRADVRHQLRRLRAARRAGEPRRRPAGAGAHRRPDRAGRAGPPPRAQGTDEELEKRRADWQQPPAKYGRGYGALYLQHITQANEGCDFDFLEAGPPVPEPEIH